jgi:hypothetical protein
MSLEGIDIDTIARITEIPIKRLEKKLQTR